MYIIIIYHILYHACMEQIVLMEVAALKHLENGQRNVTGLTFGSTLIYSYKVQNLCVVLYNYVSYVDLAA